MRQNQLSLNQIVSLILVSVYLHLLPNLTFAEGGFRVADLIADPGSHVSGYLDLSTNDEPDVRIPVTVLRGKSSGPVLALIAGTHGYEYAPILALQRIARDLDVSELRGTVIIVHIANPSAFYGRSVYVNPTDNQNLNRQYPGKQNGSYSERIAFAITHEVIEKSDYVIDMHGGDGNESLAPFVYMAVTGDQALDAQTRALAEAFGLPNIVADPGPAGAVADAMFTDRTALAMGKPALTTETGGLGSTDEKWTSMAMSGAYNVLRYLEMLPGQPDVPREQVFLHDYEVVSSPGKGIFLPAIAAGQFVSEGELLGILNDDFGNRMLEILVPFDGMVNYVVATPPVSKGEPVAMISRTH